MAGRGWGGLPSIADAPEPGLGPLGGLAGALLYARERGYNEVLTIGCDMPDVPPGLIAALVRRAPSFCADAPILGFWPSELRERLVERLGTGDDRSLRGWAAAAGALPVAAPRPLRNVNRPEDLLAS